MESRQMAKTLLTHEKEDSAEYAQRPTVANSAGSLSCAVSYVVAPSEAAVAVRLDVSSGEHGVASHF